MQGILHLVVHMYSMAKLCNYDWIVPTQIWYIECKSHILHDLILKYVNGI